MYNKIFTKILDSSIWLEPESTRLVWITFLAVMDETGFCQFACIGNVASRARLSLDQATIAIATLEAPDPNSSDTDNDGRRVERVPGGWMVLNAKKYRELATREMVKEQTRLRVADYRAKLKSVTTSNADVQNGNEKITLSDTDIKTEANTTTPKNKTKRVATLLAPLDDDELPEWMPLESWRSWVVMRSEKRIKTSGRAKTLAINKLSAFRDEGFDPAGILDNCILNGWNGIWKPKETKGYGNTSAAKVGGNIGAANDAYRILRRGDSEGSTGTQLRSLGPGRP